NINYTITVTNNSPPFMATNVIVTDLLPPEVSFVGSVPSQGTYDSGTGQWVVGAIAGGNNATLTITATVNGTAGMPITNTATVDGDQFDPNNGNDTDDATYTVTSIDLSVVKDVSNTAPDVGDPITYTITVTNNSG